MNCKNCNTEVTSKFCSDCGHPTSLSRINGHYLIHEIDHVLHFERGILFTIKVLLTNPGKNIRTYLTENRSKLVKPIIFIIVTSLIYSICNGIFHFEDAYSNKLNTTNSAASAISKWIQGHYGYANIIMAIFIALWTKLFFRKFNFNIFEILSLLCYVMGMGMLSLAVFGVIQSLAGINLIIIASLVTFIYTTWAIAQFYEKDKIMSYVKAFFAYVLGTITFYSTAIIIGITIDLLTKH
ncbi:MAG: DUF3667 domain-containing protein [Bacteroidia bacterium]|nr:DUF3667 domain-containing protein [Bacteroidia bacterium]